MKIILDRVGEEIMQDARTMQIPVFAGIARDTFLDQVDEVAEQKGKSEEIG